MSTHLIADALHIDRKTHLFLLAFYSCCGAVLGVITAYSSDPFLLSLMRAAACCRVSIVGLAVVTLFPFLITAIVYLLAKPYLLLPVAFFKSFSYTLAMSCIGIRFISAGWLVGLLLLFSDTFTAIALYWYWVRHIGGFYSSAKTDLLFCSVVSLAVGFVDYYVVSPFLVTLMND